MRASAAPAVVGFDEKCGLEVSCNHTPVTSRLKAGVLEGHCRVGCPGGGLPRGWVRNVEKVHPVVVRSKRRGHHDRGAKLLDKDHNIRYPELKAIGGGDHDRRREGAKVRQEARDGRGEGGGQGRGCRSSGQPQKPEASAPVAFRDLSGRPKAGAD